MACHRTQPSRAARGLTRMLTGRVSLPWPLPAALAWLSAWAFHVALLHGGVASGLAWLLATLPGAGAACVVQGAWRRLLVAAGFPLSSLVVGAEVPTWAWLAAAAPLALAYPMRAWSDAPFFPTPRHALRDLTTAVPLPAGASVLDAGCGLGHGLRALHAAWPQVRLHGIEWSALLAWWCARRCLAAQVHRGDMWAHPWTPYALVYLFQRPESMSRAWEKARQEMAPGTWVVSLEFAVPDIEPTLRLEAGAGRPLWVYRLPASESGSNRGRRRR